MVSKGRKAARELLRRKPRLDPRPRILIVCEGRATEPQYFRDFTQEFRSVVNLVVVDEGGTPKTLVERAIHEKQEAARRARRSNDSSTRFADIWCVFDIDEHPLIAEARLQATQHGIHCVVSNPCFELWLLLHFQDQTAHIERHDAQARCREHLVGYDKRADFRALQPEYQVAVDRAQALLDRNARDGEPERNPYTLVHQLTRIIEDIGREAFLRQVRSAR
jgi:hypothetical protein